jgi:hypothetical protein
MINRAAEFTCTYTDATGEDVQFALPDDVDDQFAALRTLLYEPRQGCVVHRRLPVRRCRALQRGFRLRGAARVPVLWPSDQAWRDDLAKFPRDPDLIPAWLPNPPQ